MNNAEHLAKQKHFCILPWVHLYHFTDKNVYPCPVMGAWGINKLGNTSDSIEKLWNNETLKELRKKMINNEPISFCDKYCNNSINSCKRHFGLELLEKARPFIESTQPDGTVDKVNFIAWNIIESNKCNFRCSYCNVKYSNRFGEKLETFNSLLELKDKLLPLIDDVEEIWFASGESSIQDSYYDILDELLFREKTDIRLYFITNLSIVEYKNKNIFNYLNKFNNVVIFGSVDDTGKRLEYIRNGSSYEKILKNRTELLQYPNIKFYLQPVISIFNIYSFPDFHKEWFDLGLVGIDKVRYYVLDSPSYLQANILPLKYKKLIIDKWVEYRTWIEKNLSSDIDTYPNRCSPTVFIDKIINYLKTPKDNSELERFFQFIAQLDKNYNMSYKEIFKEYEDIKCISSNYF